MTWQIGTKSGHNIAIVYDENDEGICEVFGMPLHTRIESLPDPETRTMRNANLIAAAPEMYETLKSYASCSDGCTCGDGWSHDAAIEALLKAEGRQP